MDFIGCMVLLVDVRIISFNSIPHIVYVPAVQSSAILQVDVSTAHYYLAAVAVRATQLDVRAVLLIYTYIKAAINHYV
jgi:hypothetical protein